MRKYEVINPNSGHSFGFYEADSQDEAIEACCIDAGYNSKSDAEEVMSKSSDLVAIEVV